MKNVKAITRPQCTTPPTPLRFGSCPFHSAFCILPSAFSILHFPEAVVPVFVNAGVAILPAVIASE